jgi:hypothetical protein
VVNLIATVKEIAGTVNTDQQALLSYQNALATTQEGLSQMARTVEGTEK